jgi:hypothetical protein
MNWTLPQLWAVPESYYVELIEMITEADKD